LYHIIPSDSEDELTRFDKIPPVKRRKSLKAPSTKRGRETRSMRSGRPLPKSNGYRDSESDVTLSDSSERAGTRRSARTHKQGSSLRYEVSDDLTDDYESEKPSSRSSVKPKILKAIESFPTDDDTDFAKRHQYWCMFSGDLGAIKNDNRSYAMCQGCSFMFHLECLGTKADRQRTGHNIIVLDEQDGKKTCVLQCGRCSGGGKNGMITMRCHVCAQVGERCGKFKHPEKSENLLEGWNDVAKLMSRCMICDRACHFHHLPQKYSPTDDDEEYWRCTECCQYGEAKVDVILGWRQTDNITDIPDFSREYLIKFENESYARALWVPATWLAGVSFTMKNNFDAKQFPPIESSKDVIPEAWLHVDIMFDVVYDNDIPRQSMKFRRQSDELAALSRVTSALCKWQTLKYEESSARYLWR
jgi:chromodomain-helicase-DNA-binding protein 4